MSDKRLTPEFGKRRPAGSLPPQPASKRSSHVALLVMGTLAVGGGAYALMPSQTCTAPQPAAPGMVAPAAPPTGTCTSRSSYYGGSGSRSWSSFHFYGGGDSSSRASSSGASEAASGGVTRGGFGSFARAFGFGGG